MRRSGPGKFLVLQCMHVCMSVAEVDLSSADSAGRKRDRPRPTTPGGLFTVVLVMVYCHCLAEQYTRLLVAQYDSIYRVTARAQGVPATRPTTAREVAPTPESWGFRMAVGSWTCVES